MKKCSVEGCKEKHHGRGYCLQHYNVKRALGELSNGECKKCKKPIYVKGFCRQHYHEYLKSNASDIAKQQTHGMSKTSEYGAWISIQDKCYRKSHPSYKYYGAIGIKVCDRWRGNFLNFIEDMGMKSSPDLTIERLNPYGDYTPENTVWDTTTAQSQNKRLFAKNTSGCTGVRWLSHSKRWRAYIGSKGTSIKLGTYKEKEDAIKARLLGELEHWGYIKQTKFKHLLK